MWPCYQHSGDHAAYTGTPNSKSKALDPLKVSNSCWCQPEPLVLCTFSWICAQKGDWCLPAIIPSEGFLWLPACPVPRKGFKLWIFAYYWLLMHGKCCIWLMHFFSLPHFSVFPKQSSSKFWVEWIICLYAFTTVFGDPHISCWGKSTSPW